MIVVTSIMDLPVFPVTTNIQVLISKVVALVVMLSILIVKMLPAIVMMLLTTSNCNETVATIESDTIINAVK